MLQSGQTIADFQIVKPLSENELFATYQVTSNIWAEAKLLLFSAGLFAEKKSADRFDNQTKVLTGQSFPGLQSLLAAGFEGDYGYCVYPLPPGVPLADRLVAEWTVEAILELIRTAAAHLIAAHESDLWHGALSPASIYLDGRSVTLDQFALPSLLPLDFHSGIDPRYTSPELVRGEAAGPATDLYSLGIVLYRLLTGSVPFSGSDSFATALLHVQGQAEPLPEKLSPLQPLLDRLLAPLPAERISAEQLVVEIDRLLVLPELAGLKAIAPEARSTEPERSNDDAPSRVEKLMNQSEMTARIEQRLKERSEILQQTEEFATDAKRANTARISTLSQEDHREKQKMNQDPYQRRRSSRFLVLIALGIAVGVIVYAVLFVAPNRTVTDGSELPETLQAGLRQGSQQLAEGKLEEAEATFLQLSDQFAAYPQPYNNLAAIAAQQGDLERSRELLERAMATDTAYATVYRNLGTVYAEMARDSYGRALQLEQGQQAVALQLFGSDELVTVAASKIAKPEQAETSSTDPAEAPQPSREEALTTLAGTAQDAEQPPVETTAAEEDITAEEVAEEVIAAEEVTAEAVQPEAVEDFLNRWAAAWSDQDVDAYLGFYAEEFKPSSGRSREAWAQLRRTRLTRPKSIEVTLSEFSVSGRDEGEIQVELTQAYQSDRYADKTRKRFELVLADNQWKILRERSLGRVR